MTVESSPIPRSHSSALRPRSVLQLAFATLGALPLPALAHDDGSGYPDAPPPAEAPPYPPRELPPPAVDVDVRITAPQPPADGQWVYTRQYSWVWMPYEQSYTYVPPEGNPVMFVYGATLGWRWVAAPWVFDYGPVPYWGARGRAHFAWYSRPWFARRDYRPVYRHDYRPVHREYRAVQRRDYRDYRHQEHRDHRAERRDYRHQEHRDHRRDEHRDHRQEARRDGDQHGRQAREGHGHDRSDHRR